MAPSATTIIPHQDRHPPTLVRGRSLTQDARPGRESLNTGPAKRLLTQAKEQGVEVPGRPDT